MLPGISGTLISASFLERVLIDEFLARRHLAPALRETQRWWRRVTNTLGPASSPRAIADAAAIPLLENCGYRLLHLEAHGASFVGAAAQDSGSPVALCVCPWDTPLERCWRDTVRSGRMSGARWGVICSGARVRIVDATRAWSRRSIEFDLSAALSDERSATAFVAILEAAGCADHGPSLDRFIQRGEQHGVQVCDTLGSGVLDALTLLFAELHSGRRQRDRRTAFEQAVILVYRLLFLLFAEARSMVPTWHQIYREAYTIEALCRRALSQPGRRGLWKSLQAISRLAHRGCRAGDLVVTPFNGRLFSPRHAPLAEHARMSDAAVGRAIISLATTTTRDSRERVAYGDLGVEQLGAVYERVLEYEPAANGGPAVLSRTSIDRKTSGSFYTPRSITEFLVRRALQPLVAGKSSEQILQLRILDPAMGSGAFLVAACRYLSDAVERALVEEGTLRGDSTREERSVVRRLVVQRCLFGVDRNPMAVQLARLSLWLASLSADRPLTFLDHHLACGDSLIGVTLADLARMPAPLRASRPHQHQLPLFDSGAAREFSQTVLPERFRIASEPDDTPAAVHAKERALAQLAANGTPLSRWKDAANLWCASSFWSGDRLTRGVYHDLFDELTGRPGMLSPAQHAAVLEQARRLAAAFGFFHWELEFPEVFLTPSGHRDPHSGFDAVLGNPPWDVIRADSGDRATRNAARDDHRARLRFFRGSQVYRCQGRGHANSYQLFVERALQLTRPGGRIALIVPSGLATDQGSAALREVLLDNTSVERVFGFDNRNAIFPIHRDVRFLLLTATQGQPTERLTGVYGLTDVRWLDELPDAAREDPAGARHITVARSSLSSWDREHSTWPWLTARSDLEILARVSETVPRLSDASGWNITFGRELNATDDRIHFSPRPAATGASLLPIIEGKHLEPFRARIDACPLVIPASTASSLIDAAHSFARSRLAYRDVASATNRLTLIAARLPAGVISTHTVFCSRDRLSADAQYCLLALLNSLVANYLVRLWVTTHVTTALMARLPVPRPASASPEFRELVTLAKQLERDGTDAHPHAYARMNAIAAHLYGLTRDQYQRVLETFPLLGQDLRDLALAAYAQATEEQSPPRQTQSYSLQGTTTQNNRKRNPQK